jgi:hypothetical protein
MQGPLDPVADQIKNEFHDLATGKNSATLLSARCL